MKTSLIRYRVADFLRRYPPFQFFCEEELLELAASGRVQFLENAEFVFRTNQPRRSFIWVVQQGTVELLANLPDREQLRNLLGPARTPFPASYAGFPVSRSYRPATRRPERNQWRSFGRLLPLEHSCRMRWVRAPAVYNSLKASEDHYVELQTEQMNDGTLKVNLLGRLDIIGTNAIDLRFTSLTATRKANVIVDLSGVDFLASMGVRLLLSNAKALASRGGKMVICKPDPMVRKVLETTGTDAIIPLYDDVDSAHRALKPP